MWRACSILSIGIVLGVLGAWWGGQDKLNKMKKHVLHLIETQRKIDELNTKMSQWTEEERKESLTLSTKKSDLTSLLENY